MKRLTAFLAVCLMLLPLLAWGAGSVTVTTENILGQEIRLIKFAWTGDSSDGSVPATTLTTTQAQFVQGYYLCGAQTDPGGTSPTSNYDITITDSGSNDLMGGELANRSATATEYVIPKLNTSVYGCRFVVTPLTMTLTGNSVNSATGTITLFFAKP